MLMRQNIPRNERQVFFTVEIAELFHLLKIPFGQAFYLVTKDHMVDGNFTTVKHRTIEIRAANNMLANQKLKGTVMFQVRKGLNEKLAASLSRKIPKLISEKSLTVPSIIHLGSNNKFHLHEPIRSKTYRFLTFSAVREEVHCQQVG